MACTLGCQRLAVTSPARASSKSSSWRCAGDGGGRGSIVASRHRGRRGALLPPGNKWTSGAAVTASSTSAEDAAVSTTTAAGGGDVRTPLSAVIVGGGIGGLAMCVALRRVGIDAHVYERARDLNTNAGTGLALWPNGIWALRSIGPDVAEEVTSRGCSVYNMAMPKTVDDRAGKQGKEEVPVGGFKATLGKVAGKMIGAVFPMVMRMQNGGAGLVTIRWAALQSALASFLPASCIHLDSSLDELEMLELANGAEKVRCTFKRRDGTAVTDEPIVADFLIGADGINSAVRKAILGDRAPTDHGRVIWRGVIDVADLSATGMAIGPEGFPEFAPTGGFTIGSTMLASKDLAVGRTVMFMDVGGGKMYWAAGCLDEVMAASAANSTPISSAAPVDGDERAARGRASCAATFASYPDVTACLAVTPTGAGGLFTSRIIDRPPLTPAEASKFVGPITLTGDAAHPVLPSFGQGANLALEDAADLATTLAAAYTADTASSSGQPTIAATLRAWEEKRRERTREAQIGSFISGSKSYGEEKLAQAIATSSIPAEDIAAYNEKYPSYNAAFSSLLKWRPMTGSEPLSALAPAAAMSLARWAANVATGAGPLDDNVYATSSSRRDVLSALAAGGVAQALLLTRAPAAQAAADTAAATVTSEVPYESDGFRMTLPAGWTTVEVPGVGKGGH